LLLFACACCRRIWHFVKDDRSRRGVEAVEAFVDGQSDREEIGRAYLAALLAAEEQDDHAHHACIFPAVAEYENRLERHGHYQFLMTRRPQFDDHHVVCAWQAAALAAAAVAPPESDTVSEDELVAQADLLREIFGNPFRPARRSSRWATPTTVA